MYLYTSCNMSSRKTSKTGRPPESKGPLRNFRLHTLADGFLTDEKIRSHHDLTFIVEAALVHIAGLKPAARDEVFRSFIQRRTE